MTMQAHLFAPRPIRARWASWCLALCLALLALSFLMLGVSYYWFLRSTLTINGRGITQTWLYNRDVEWRDVRSAKMIGIPYLSWLFPPRMVVRTEDRLLQREQASSGGAYVRAASLHQVLGPAVAQAPASAGAAVSRLIQIIIFFVKYSSILSKG